MKTFSAMLQLHAFTVEFWRDPLQESFVLEQQCLILWLALPVKASTQSTVLFTIKVVSMRCIFFFLRYVA